MKKIYLGIFPVICFLVITGCGKNSYYGYEEKLPGGVWYFAGSSSSGTGDTETLDFHNGYFSFMREGRLLYTNKAGTVYTGFWELEREIYDDQETCNLKLVAGNTQTQEHLSVYYSDVTFKGDNCFEAYVSASNRLYRFEFKR